MVPRSAGGPRDGRFSHIARVAAKITLALLFALCAMAAPARAQEGEADARARALELFRESAELYRQGRFEDAAMRLRVARDLHPEPILSYNLARALEGAGDLEGAVAAYRDYLDEAPDAEDAPAVRARLEGLERHLAEVRALEADRERLRASREARERERERAEGEARAPAPSRRGPDALPWVIAGGGGVVLIAGAVLGGLAVARNDDAMEAPDHAAAVAASDEAHDLATAANVTLIAGGALALVGVIWGTIDLVAIGGERGSERAGAALELGPGSIAIRGTF